MKKKLSIFSLLIVLSISLTAQVAPGFNFQGVARNADGEPLINQSVDLIVGIRSGSPSGTVIWEEEHASSTNEFGLFTLKICGNNSLRTGGTAATVDDIDWAADKHYIDLQMDVGQGLVDLGVSQLLSVPYSMVTSSYPSSVSEMSVQPESQVPPGEALFMVKREDGYPVFAVYEDGVWVFTDESAGEKGVKGGFAVGGYNTESKGPGSEYFMVSPDSARIYVSNDAAKGVKGGFAVGGYKKENKGPVDEYMRVTRDSTRIYVNTDPQKGVKGGFAVGGYKKENKAGEDGSFMSLQRDNYFIGHNSGAKIDGGVFNSVLGYESGLSITSGSSNAFLGYQAGYSNTYGSGNLFLGYQTGYSNEEGGDNTFVGNSAGYSNYIGIHNTFLGSFSGYSNVNGGFNTFVGDSAGYSNTNGYSNTIIGTSAGLSNTTGYSNLIIGNKAGYKNTVGSLNVFVGHESGAMNTTGGDNVFVGTRAGYATTGGYSNTFIGTRTGENNTQGYSNLMLGTEAGFSNYDGAFNVFLGHQSGYSNSTGIMNSFIGFESGLNNEEGSHNIYLGTHSGMSNPAGEANVFVGYGTGRNTKGDHNVFIGNRAGQDQQGSGKLIISNTEADSTTALIWGDFYGQALRFNSHIGIGMNPSWQPLVINVPDDVAILPLYGTGNEWEYSAVELNADLSSEVNYYSMSHTKNHEFAIKQAVGGVYTTKFMINSDGHAAINNNSAHQTLQVNDPNSSSHLGLVGVGNQWDYSLLSFETSGVTDNPQYTFAHKKNHEFELIYSDDDEYNLLLKFTSSGNVGVGEWVPTERLDVNGNARFRGVPLGAGDDLVIAADGTLGRSASDARLKSDFLPMLNSLEMVMLMDGYTFTWIDDEEKVRDAGLVAQDVAEIFPEAVFENPNDGYMGINYSRFPALFVEAIKEQQTIIEDQKEEIEFQQEEIKKLKVRMEHLEEMILSDH